MNQQNITHNNHYVPRFYLRNWSKDGTTVYTYSLLVSNSKVPYWRQESIKNAAVWYDLYTRMIEQQEIDDFETWFDREFESPVKPVFDKIICGERLSHSDSIALSRFVAAQHIRTPARLDMILEMERKELPHILESALQKLNRELLGKKTCYTPPVSTPENNLIPLKVSVNKEKSLVKAETIVGKGMYLYALRHLLTQTVAQMYRHHWQIIHAAEGVSFPTSDDPVICLNFRNEDEYNFDGGWGRKHGNIILPISPQILLFTQIDDDFSAHTLDYSLHWSKFFRKIIIEHAHRSVFADTPQKGMLFINPRIVDKALYDEERKAIQSWHRDQILAEEQLALKNMDD